MHMAKNKNNGFKNTSSGSSRSNATDSSKNTTSGSSKNSTGGSMKDSHSQVPGSGPSRSGPGGE
jgi:hypothetical protein